MQEVKFELFGKDYVARPTFRVVQAIESMTNKGTLEIAQDIVAGRFKTTDIVSVLFCMVDEPKKNINKVADEVMGNVSEYLSPVAEFLAACNCGSNELAVDGDEEDTGGKEKNG